MAIFFEEDSHITEEGAVCGALPHMPGGNSVTAIGQTFTTGDNYDLTKVTLKLRKAGSPGRCFVDIYAVNGDDLPTGSTLGFGSFNANNITESASGELVDIPITPTSLTTGTIYAIVITAPDGTIFTDVIKFLGSIDEDGESYADGTTVQLLDGVWEERIVSGIFFTDAYFQTYSE